VEGLGPGSLRRVTISLNGKTIDTRDAKTIAELIDRYQLPPQSVLVEHNGLAVHRHEWPERTLVEGDQVELVRVVAGG
jgi:thiamine biosynthesis protein ThiS